VVDVIRRQELTRRGLETLLADLEACPGDWLTVCLPPGARPSAGASLDPTQAAWLEEIDALAEELDSETGAVFFWGEARRLVVLPPFPLREACCRSGCDASPLRSLLSEPRRMGVVLLRLGHYAVGLFEGERLVDSKTGHRFVKGRHKAGGQSAQRFVRIREGQIREMFDKACEAVQARFEPVERELDHIFLGGDRHTLGAFLKRCPYLRRLEDRTMKRLLPVARPGQDALEAMPREIFKSQVLFVG
jgi:peptide subunit release factor 1 (eRF1)